MNQPSIVPSHVLFPRTFTSTQVYLRDDHLNRWVVDEGESDQPLNEQLHEFVKSQGAMVGSISPPNVNVFEDGPTRRVYVTSVSLLYIPQQEGTDDQPRDVDA